MRLTIYNSASMTGTLRRMTYMAALTAPLTYFIR
jgi:hypothetical protein